MSTDKSKKSKKTKEDKTKDVPKEEPEEEVEEEEVVEREPPEMEKWDNSEPEQDKKHTKPREQSGTNRGATGAAKATTEPPWERSGFQSITSFNFDDVRKFDKDKLTGVSNVDLLKVLVVRGADELNPQLRFGARDMLKKLNGERLQRRNPRFFNEHTPRPNFDASAPKMR